MRKLVASVVAVLLVQSCAIAHVIGRKPELRAAVHSSSRVPKYGLLELTLDLSVIYDNPFNPDDVDVYAMFTSPARKTVRINGFLYRPYTRSVSGGQEKLTASGPAVWKVRFTPDTVGPWQYQVFARDRNGTAQLAPALFRVTPSSDPGFIGRSATNPAVFAYKEGQPFFAVGENLSWGGNRGTYDYDMWLTSLGQARANWIRVWMSSWNCAIEWTHNPQDPNDYYAGLGVYNLANAWKLDYILDQAQRQGVSVMLCLGTYGELTQGGYFNEGQWPSNPYNVANGGPCAQPSDFWTDPTARKLYRQRLRYLAARYGWHTNLHAWEFWNEAYAPADWVAEMGQFLKGTGAFRGQPADPYRHLVTTTYGNAEVWQVPEVDFTQSHIYGTGDAPDFAPVAHDDAANNAPFAKPHLLAEFGIDWRKGDEQYDTTGQGTNLHNALWASALSGNGGGAMIWWWDGYVHPKNLYGEFTALRRFSDAVPWTLGRWLPLQAQVRQAPDGSVNLYGLRWNRTAILWAQNAQHNWMNVWEGNSIPTITDAQVVVKGLPAGLYIVEWWDTGTGTVARRLPARSTASGMALSLPDLSTDVAARIVPILTVKEGRTE